MKLLVFYRRIVDVPDGVARVRGASTTEEKYNLVADFAAGRVNPLYCHIASISGWQLPPMYDDEYSIEFVGDGWSEMELAQGRGRIRRRSG